MSPALLVSLLLHGLVLAAFAWQRRLPVDSPPAAPLRVRLEATVAPPPLGAVADARESTPRQPPAAAASAARQETRHSEARRSRVWQRTARDVIKDLARDGSRSPYIGPPRGDSGLAPEPPRSASFERLSREFKPLSGPLRVCGKLAELDLGHRKLTLPTTASCDDAEVFGEEKD